MSGSLRFDITSGLVVQLCVLIIMTAIGCSDIKRNNSHRQVSMSDIKAGKKLAAKYCQSCHPLPDPSLLDSETWEKGVLPFMGPRLGIFKYNFVNYPSYKHDKNLEPGFYPVAPIVSLKEWHQIVSYYTAASPDSIPVVGTRIAIHNELPGFKVFEPNLVNDNPATTLVKVIKEGNATGLIVNDAYKHTLFRFNSKMELADSVVTAGPIVDIELNDKIWITCDIGVLNPNNGKFGRAATISSNGAGKLQLDSNILFNKLARPVQITSSDFNNDGNTDYLVCEFGFLTGALSWMENAGNGKFKRRVITSLPGAIKAYVEDYNHDGLNDIWVLFAQGKEGVFLYTNKGDGNFEQREVLSFPSVYGSSYFEMVDFNNDGHKDIIYTCGDNADYSAMLKPYHGVYIYINDGQYNFKQQYFFHINGCFKAIARDYDEDGDVDIATISFFADYLNKPEEGFVYLENKGGYIFSPSTFSASQKGRWLTMDAGDINGDGKVDLVLGNFSVGPLMKKPKRDWRKGPPFIVLQNLSK